MIVTLPPSVYARVRKGLERSFEDYAGLYTDVMRSVVTTHLAFINNSHLGPFFFILGRTLRFNKMAQSVYFAQFQKGVQSTIDPENQVSAAVNMSRNTIRNTLQELAESDYINVYRGDTGSDGVPSLYEINVEKLLGFPVYEAKTLMPLRDLKTKRAQLAAENRAKNDVLPPPKNWDTPLPKIGTLKYRLLKQKEEPSVAARSATAMETISKVQAKHVAKRTARISSAKAKPASKLSKEEMQAVIDAMMADYYPDLPRVLVTNRDAGLLRKRMAAQEPGDFRGFVSYIASNWSTIVAQNTKALQRKLRSGQSASTPLQRTFNVHDLAIRYPYFLAIFVNGTVSTDASSEKTDEAARTQARLEAAQREVEVLRERLQRRPKATAPATMVRPPRGRSVEAQAEPVKPLPRRTLRTTAKTDDELLAGFADLISGEREDG